MSETKTFESWAIVEVMGHRQFAGFVTEQAIGGASFVRVDVPAVHADGDELPGFTKLLGAGSIYAISPCTEETAKAFAARARARAFSVYEAPRLPAPSSAEVWADPIPEADPDDDYDDPEDEYDDVPV